VLAPKPALGGNTVDDISEKLERIARVAKQRGEVTPLPDPFSVREDISTPDMRATVEGALKEQEELLAIERIAPPVFRYTREELGKILAEKARITRQRSEVTPAPDLPITVPLDISTPEMQAAAEEQAANELYEARKTAALGAAWSAVEGTGAVLGDILEFVTEGIPAAYQTAGEGIRATNLATLGVLRQLQEWNLGGDKFIDVRTNELLGDKASTEERIAFKQQLWEVKNSGLWNQVGGSITKDNIGDVVELVRVVPEYAKGSDALLRVGDVGVVEATRLMKTLPSDVSGAEPGNKLFQDMSWEEVDETKAILENADIDLAKLNRDFSEDELKEVLDLSKAMPGFAFQETGDLDRLRELKPLAEKVDLTAVDPSVLDPALKVDDLLDVPPEILTKPDWELRKSLLTGDPALDDSLSTMPSEDVEILDRLRGTEAQEKYMRNPELLVTDAPQIRHLLDQLKFSEREAAGLIDTAALRNIKDKDLARILLTTDRLDLVSQKPLTPTQTKALLQLHGKLGLTLGDEHQLWTDLTPDEIIVTNKLVDNLSKVPGGLEMATDKGLLNTAADKEQLTRWNKAVDKFVKKGVDNPDLLWNVARDTDAFDALLGSKKGVAILNNLDGIPRTGLKSGALDLIKDAATGGKLPVFAKQAIESGSAKEIQSAAAHLKLLTTPMFDRPFIPKEELGGVDNVVDGKLVQLRGHLATNKEHPLVKGLLEGKAPGEALFTTKKDMLLFSEVLSGVLSVPGLSELIDVEGPLTADNLEEYARGLNNLDMVPSWLLQTARFGDLSIMDKYYTWKLAQLGLTSVSGPLGIGAQLMSWRNDAALGFAGAQTAKDLYNYLTTEASDTELAKFATESAPVEQQVLDELSFYRDELSDEEYQMVKEGAQGSPMGDMLNKMDDANWREPDQATDWMGVALDVASKGYTAYDLRRHYREMGLQSADKFVGGINMDSKETWSPLELAWNVALDQAKKSPGEVGSVADIMRAALETTYKDQSKGGIRLALEAAITPGVQQNIGAIVEDIQSDYRRLQDEIAGAEKVKRISERIEKGEVPDGQFVGKLLPSIQDGLMMSLLTKDNSVQDAVGLLSEKQDLTRDDIYNLLRVLDANKDEYESLVSRWGQDAVSFQKDIMDIWFPDGPPKDFSLPEDWDQKSNTEKLWYGLGSYVGGEIGRIADGSAVGVRAATGVPRKWFGDRPIEQWVREWRAPDSQSHVNPEMYDLYLESKDKGWGIDEILEDDAVSPTLENANRLKVRAYKLRKGDAAVRHFEKEVGADNVVTPIEEEALSRMKAAQKADEVAQVLPPTERTRLDEVVEIVQENKRVADTYNNFPSIARQFGEEVSEDYDFEPGSRLLEPEEIDVFDESIKLRSRQEVVDWVNSLPDLESKETALEFLLDNPSAKLYDRGQIKPEVKVLGEVRKVIEDNNFPLEAKAPKGYWEGTQEGGQQAARLRMQGIKDAAEAYGEAIKEVESFPLSDQVKAKIREEAETLQNTPITEESAFKGLEQKIKKTQSFIQDRQNQEAAQIIKDSDLTVDSGNVEDTVDQIRTDKKVWVQKKRELQQLANSPAGREEGWVSPEKFERYQEGAKQLASLKYTLPPKTRLEELREIPAWRALPELKKSVPTPGEAQSSGFQSTLGAPVRWLGNILSSDNE
jgi:hypothetical protein